MGGKGGQRDSKRSAVERIELNPSSNHALFPGMTVAAKELQFRKFPKLLTALDLKRNGPKI